MNKKLAALLILTLFFAQAAFADEINVSMQQLEERVVVAMNYPEVPTPMRDTVLKQLDALKTLETQRLAALDELEALDEGTRFSDRLGKPRLNDAYLTRNAATVQQLNKELAQQIARLDELLNSVGFIEPKAVSAAAARVEALQTEAVQKQVVELTADNEVAKAAATRTSRATVLSEEAFNPVLRGIGDVESIPAASQPLKEDIASVKEKITPLKAQLEESGRLAGRVADFEGQAAALQAQNAEMKAKLAKLANKYATTVEYIEGLEAKTAEAQRLNAQTAEELRQNYARELKNSSELSDRVIKAEAALGEQTRLSNSLQTELNARQARINSLEEQLARVRLNEPFNSGPVPRDKALILRPKTPSGTTGAGEIPTGTTGGTTPPGTPGSGAAGSGEAGAGTVKPSGSTSAGTGTAATGEAAGSSKAGLQGVTVKMQGTNFNVQGVEGPVTINFTNNGTIFNQRVSGSGSASANVGGTGADAAGGARTATGESVPRSQGSPENVVQETPRTAPGTARADAAREPITNPERLLPAPETAPSVAQGESAAAARSSGASIKGGLVRGFVWLYFISLAGDLIGYSVQAAAYPPDSYYTPPRIFWLDYPNPAPGECQLIRAYNNLVGNGFSNTQCIYGEWLHFTETNLLSGITHSTQTIADTENTKKSLATTTHDLLIGKKPGDRQISTLVIRTNAAKNIFAIRDFFRAVVTDNGWLVIPDTISSLVVPRTVMLRYDMAAYGNENANDDTKLTQHVYLVVFPKSSDSDAYNPSSMNFSTSTGAKHFEDVVFDSVIPCQLVDDGSRTYWHCNFSSLEKANLPNGKYLAALFVKFDPGIYTSNPTVIPKLENLLVSEGCNFGRKNGVNDKDYCPFFNSLLVHDKLVEQIEKATSEAKEENGYWKTIREPIVSNWESIKESWKKMTNPRGVWGAVGNALGGLVGVATLPFSGADAVFVSNAVYVQTVSEINVIHDVLVDSKNKEASVAYFTGLPVFEEFEVTGSTGTTTPPTTSTEPFCTSVDKLANPQISFIEIGSNVYDCTKGQCNNLPLNVTSTEKMNVYFNYPKGDSQFSLDIWGLTSSEDKPPIDKDSDTAFSGNSVPNRAREFSFKNVSDSTFTSCPIATPNINTAVFYTAGVLSKYGGDYSSLSGQCVAGKTYNECLLALWNGSRLEPFTSYTKDNLKLDKHVMLVSSRKDAKPLVLLRSSDIAWKSSAPLPVGLTKVNASAIVLPNNCNSIMECLAVADTQLASDLLGKKKI